MLAAEVNGGKILADDMPDEVARDFEWMCPICECEVIYVTESVDGRISHFRHDTEPEHERIAESQRHERAKLDIYRRLENQYVDVEVEHEVGSGRIADVFISSRNIAVEIQCSKQPVGQFKRRTREYSRDGIATLWLVDRETYTPKKTDTETPGVLYSDHVKWLENVYDGNVYFLDDVGEYYERSIRHATRSVQNASGQWYDKKYKTVGVLQNRTPIAWDFETQKSYQVYRVAHP